MKITSAIMIATALGCPPAFGQSLNIDFGGTAGGPPADYAAAGLPGTWNTLAAGPGVPQMLVGLTGDAVAATVSHSLGSVGGMDDPATSEFDEALLDDGVFGLGDVAFSICFQDLINGFYEVTTYGWTPTVPTDATLVIPNDDYNGGLIAGGPWPGALAEGVTHVVHQVWVTDGTMILTVVGGYWGATGFVNGIQLRKTAAGQACSLPADVGPCDGVCPRYFYDVCTGACELFNYGCCGGNANNFETLQECEASCPPESDICFLPADPGPCEGLCPRFFYNVCSGECEEFTYGCCDGNANNFETIEQCRSACPAGLCSADFNSDGAVDAADLAQLLVTWGPCGGCPADFNADGHVDGLDLADLLAAWGACS